MSPPHKRARVCFPPTLADQPLTITHLPSPVSEYQAEKIYFESAAERIKRRRKAEQLEQTSVQQSLRPQSEAIKEQPPSPPVSLHDDKAIDDESFAKAVLDECAELQQDHDNNFGLRQMIRVTTLLRKATRATQEEGPWLTAEQAADYVRPGFLHKGPIFVEHQQPHNLVTVKEFLSEFYDDSTGIYIQDAAAGPLEITTREVSVEEVKKRLGSDTPSKYPWNCLEIACPIEDGIRPLFLNSAECRLLTKIKIPPEAAGAQKAGRRPLAPGYKEAEKWVLLAEAGSLTEPHQDSHGLNTFITVNDGQLGFGWLYKPTFAERRSWLKHPDSFCGGTWRYVVLRPGQTVYFPAGTVHFVFRLKSAGHTLAFGGFGLRCSTVMQWAEALIEERNHPYITNEDLTTSTISYLNQVERFVLQALSRPDDEEGISRWGGKDAIEKFLRLKKSFVGPTKKSISLDGSA